MSEDKIKEESSPDNGLPQEPEVGGSTPLNFTVDAALLQELGERLVGKPFTALAELVKNSYDADAEHVVIRFGRDEIEISDDGHGMDFNAFVSRWMRVGSTHKRTQEKSPEKKRPLTGSKGVGRLAAQFLSSSLTVISTAKGDDSKHLDVSVDWQNIADAKDLQDVQASLSVVAGSSSYPHDSKHGTKIVLRGLRQLWTAEELSELAKELWFLQPPDEIGGDFKVTVESANSALANQFDKQMRAILDVWEAKITGQLFRSSEGKQVMLKLHFKDSEPESFIYNVGQDCPETLKFDIRVYDLNYRQPSGIKVGDARSYMNEFGGIHVYDSGFHLPFYGPETDWLDLEFDHSHRLSRSKLLPDDLQMDRAMNNLPTNSRLLGIVQVSTSAEQVERDSSSLGITITRDRLIENDAYEALKKAVRWSIDYYSLRVTQRKLAQAQQQVKKENPTQTVTDLKRTIEDFASQLPPSALTALNKATAKAEVAIRNRDELYKAQTSLLATLATAGMSSLAFEHEASKQMATLETLLASFERNNADRTANFSELSNSIKTWIVRARELQSLFGHLKNERDRKDKKVYRALRLVGLVVPQVQPLLKGIQVDFSEIDPGLKLPAATFAEWTSILQNALVNSSNAMLDSNIRHIRISSNIERRTAMLNIEDTGVGVDLSDAEELFEPFERRLQLSVERQNMGLGGTGLGLTIIRMLTTNLGARVQFVAPSDGYATCLEISWKYENSSN